MKRPTLSRRTMLRGSAVAIGLPLLDVMPSAAADDATPTSKAVRAAYLYIPNGVADGAWEADQVDASGRIQALNPWMSPLESLKEQLLIPRNVWTPRGNGHGAGTATWLTGGNYDDRNIRAGGLSADQIAARAVGDATLLPSLELSLQGEGYFSNSLVRNSISWSETGPVPRDVEPRVIFDRMFRRSTQAAAQASILDEVLDDARSMHRRGSVDDRRKIDEYLQAIRAIERRIAFSDRQAARAKRNRDLDQQLHRPPTEIPPDHGDYMRTMFDMLVLAFWSDATRVATFMLDHGQSNRYFNFIDGVQGTWHALSHWKDASGKTDDDDGTTSWESPSAKREQYNRVSRWHHAQVAYFLKRLHSIREPDGTTLLDNSMILYGSNLADGHEHGERNLPLLLAGGGGGTIRTGRQLKFHRDTSMSDLHLAMLQRIAPGIHRFAESRAPMTL
ncbi:MAG: DUF1552 domain-containing protein, partial [Planctomycetota bacterium]